MSAEASSLLALAYLVVGFVFAAAVFEMMNGNVDPGCGSCAECRRTGADEAKHTMELIQLARGTDRGRLVVALFTALMCLMCILIWPGLLAVLAVLSRKRKKERL